MMEKKRYQNSAQRTDSNTNQTGTMMTFWINR